MHCIHSTGLLKETLTAWLTTVRILYLYKNFSNIGEEKRQFKEIEFKQYRKIMLKTRFQFQFLDPWSLYLFIPLYFTEHPESCLVSSIYLDFMYKFITVVYSPGSERGFIIFGWWLKTLLSCSLYSMENYCLLHLDSHCHCINLTTRHGECRKFSMLRTQLVTSPDALAPFLHTHCPGSQLCFSGLEGGQLAWCSWRSPLFFTYWRWRPSLYWAHQDRKQVWLAKDLVVDILRLGTSDV